MTDFSEDSITIAVGNRKEGGNRGNMEKKDGEQGEIPEDGQGEKLLC